MEWIGLKNSDDVGILFDLKCNVYLDNVLKASGELNSVFGGSSGFSGANLYTIGIPPVTLMSGQLKVELLVRNACLNSGKSSGTARLWYNGQPIDAGPSRDAGTRVALPSVYFERTAFLLSPTAGASRTFIDKAAGAPCSPFVPFGIWTTTIP